MSKLETSWTADLLRAAKLDGWLLAWCINHGQPISRAYLEIFEHGPRFEDRERAGPSWQRCLDALERWRPTGPAPPLPPP